MTTIIVVVVVALVFFVAVCVVTFMVWKRESEMRTDSIRAIEENLERLAQGFSGDSLSEDAGSFTERRTDGKDISYMDSVIAESMPVKPRKKRGYDPFGWVRDEENRVRSDKENEALVALREKAAEPEENIEDKDSSGDSLQSGGDAVWQTEPEEMSEESAADEPNAVRPEEDIGSHVDNLEDSEDSEVIGDIDLKEPEAFEEYEVPQPAEPEDAPDSISDNIADIRKLIAAYGDGEVLDESPEEEPDDNPIEEIRLDFMDKMDCEAEENDIESGVSHRQEMGYDIGRSGKKYTASELETLIKE